MREPLKRQSKRKPTVIEFSGTPTAGKDTAIRIFEDFLAHKRGYRVLVIRETVEIQDLARQRDIYGISLKVSLTTSRLIEAVQQIGKDYDYIFINRGPFDVLGFVEMYSKMGWIKKDEKEVLSSFVKLHRHIGLIDKVVLLLVDPQEAIIRKHQQQRRYASLLMQSLGYSAEVQLQEPHIIEPTALESLNQAYLNLFDYYSTATLKHPLADLHKVDTTNLSIEEVTKRLASIFSQLMTRT